jgi:multiple sugar transport system permease protein
MTVQTSTGTTRVDSAPRALTRRKRTTVWYWVGETLKYSILIVLTVSFMLPFYWMAATALKDDVQTYVLPPIWIPNPAHWNNYWDAWTLFNFTRYALNTVFLYAIPVTVGAVLSSSIVAYGFGRMQWPGRDALFGLCLATMMIPFQVCMVPLFIIFKHLNWINTYRPLVVPSFFGVPFQIFMLRQFYMSIPQELSDAARIDGASEFRILWQIIWPLSKPALAALALFRFRGAWNDYMGPLIYLHDRELSTLSLGIGRLRTDLNNFTMEKLTFPYLMAVSTIVTVPLVIAFFFAQRTFIEGISMTGLKG